MKNKLSNHGIAIIGIVVLTFLLIASTGSTPAATSTSQSNQQGQTTQNAPIYWTADGGEGKSLTVLPPRGSGLTESQAYLPDLVANELVSNFSNFSAMTLFDRVNNQKQYDELLSGVYDDKDKAGLDIGHLTSTDYMLLGDITKTSTGYALQLTVNKNSDKTTVATYSGTVTIAELDNLTGVRKASLDLLQKMGVQVTALARTELAGAASTNHVNAQTALARGVTAQRQGTEVAALSYYFQAAAFDSSLLEVESRSSILFATINSGNIGNDVRNDIQWRRDWVARLTATENSFYQMINAANPPYTLFYSAAIEQGKINYQTETVDMSIPINLHGSKVWMDSVQKALQVVYDGLNATKRKNDWELGNWPVRGVSNTNPFGSQKQYDMTFVFELLDQQGKVIGRQTVRQRPTFSFSGWGSQVSVNYNENSFDTVTFNAVKANDITNNLTIRIASVNGAPPENARFQITSLPAELWNEYRSGNGLFPVRVVKGVATGFSPSLSDAQIRQYSDLVVYSEAWGEPFVRITSIGERAFAGKQLTSVTLPSSVTSVGAGAFSNNKITSITIGSNVHLGESAFNYPAFIQGNSTFDYVYTHGGRQAGTYTFHDSNGAAKLLAGNFGWWGRTR